MTSPPNASLLFRGSCHINICTHGILPVFYAFLGEGMKKLFRAWEYLGFRFLVRKVCHFPIFSKLVSLRLCNFDDQFQTKLFSKRWKLPNYPFPPKMPQNHWTRRRLMMIENRLLLILRLRHWALVKKWLRRSFIIFNFLQIFALVQVFPLYHFWDSRKSWKFTQLSQFRVSPPWGKGINTRSHEWMFYLEICCSLKVGWISLVRKWRRLVA